MKCTSKVCEEGTCQRLEGCDLIEGTPECTFRRDQVAAGGYSIITWSGRYLDFWDPRMSQICIEDIAHALSKLCRFNGHCSKFYSVAQHSVLVSEIVPDEFKMAALLHDATEAYACDIPRPLKKLLPDYRTVYDKVEKAVIGYFMHKGVLKSPEIPDEVHKADLILLCTEKRDITCGQFHNWSDVYGVEPLKKKIKPVLPARACQMFLNRYEELLKKVC